MRLRTRFQRCPICGGTAGKPVGTFDCTAYPHYTKRLPKTLSWLRCPICEHVYTDSYWTKEGLRRLLAKAHANQVADGDFDKKRMLWAPVVREVALRLRHPETVFGGQATWLDVGCGDGALVMTAAEFGFDAIGLDSRREAVRKLAKLGYKAMKGNFLNWSAPKRVDVISMADVLEHLPYPLLALRKAHTMLAPGGVLYLSCPNLESASWRAMDRSRDNPYWIEMEHCHNFSRRSLMRILRENEFHPIHYGVSQRYMAGMEIVAIRETRG